VIGPYPLAPVVERLKAGGSPLKIVGNAADLSTAVQQQPRATPAAYVVRQERAQPSRGASGGVLVQQMGVDVIVVLYVRNQAAADTGAAALAEMTALAGFVRERLLNWRAHDDTEPLTANASRDEGFNAGLLVSQELFRSAYRIEVRP
jgi:hypothetical protein